MTDLAAEYRRLLDDWDHARRFEQSVALETDAATRATAAEMTRLAFDRIQGFRRNLATAFDMLVKCKLACDPNGDAALEMVLGEGMVQALDQRFARWQAVADALVKKVAAMEAEMKYLRKVQLARTA